MIVRTYQCKHRHVSGRRCAERVPVVSTYCKVHKNGTCSECKAMMEAFKPPKGWKRNDGHY